MPHSDPAHSGCFNRWLDLAVALLAGCVAASIRADDGPQRLPPASRGAAPFARDPFSSDEQTPRRPNEGPRLTPPLGPWSDPTADSPDPSRFRIPIPRLDERTPDSPATDLYAPSPLSSDAAAALFVRRLIRSIPADDFTAATLRQKQDELQRRFAELTPAPPGAAGPDRAIPLVVKAEYLEQVLARYHLAPYHVAHHTVVLPQAPGSLPEHNFGDDVATWHGALLGALSYKWAVTHDPETLATIVRLADGLHFLQTVTGKRGLVARCVLQSPTPVLKANRPYLAPDGTRFHYLSDAAKGTYNQVAYGYATMLLLVDDLPAETRTQAAHDLTEMVIHLIDHKWKITEADGKHTEYGDLTPRFGLLSVPFNAQLAYAMVAAAHHLPGGDPIQQKMIRREFERLREKHHVYFEDPRLTPVPPQSIGANPLVKGMNDRNHVVNAAYLGLLIELDTSRRQGRPFDPKFVYELGQTLAWAMQELQPQRNALCNAMWGGLLGDPAVFRALVPPAAQETAWRQRQQLVADAREQLARAAIDRFHHPGRKIETREPQWLDAQRWDETYCWKAGCFYRWEPNAPPTSLLTFGADYLHAYWLMRYWGLE